MTGSRWVAVLVDAMTLFFPCKVYSMTYKHRTRLVWTFYGLAEETVAAAQAFEAIHNLIRTWSVQNKSAKGLTGKK